MLTFAACGDSNNTNDELGHDHASSPEDEDRPSTKPFDNPESNGCRADIDKGGDEGYKKGIFDCVKTLEEDDAEIKDEVDTWN